ncbi:MAG: PhnD/SsuA/transferrin family substrate-binding protein [Chromatiaceae bacterium]|nr:PhnD/SsuA/transferrin family substrate-binding protein [Chromatiaceae bacterium]
MARSDHSTTCATAPWPLATTAPSAAIICPRFMWKAGLTLADLKDYAYLGRHERVALAVVHGDFDAGGLREDVARLYLDRGLRIIAESPLLPPHVIVARPGLAPSVTDALRAALLEPDANAIPLSRPLDRVLDSAR